jgi:hypothetical protein
MPDSSPLATIYAVQLSLIQTLEVSTSFSDYDAKPVTYKKPFVLWTAGTIPARVSAGAPALWKSETSGFEIEKVGRLPDDEFCRPTTPDR